MLIFKYFRKFILFIIKEITSAIILLGIVIGLIAFVSINLNKKIEDKPQISENTYITLSFPNGIKENKSFEFNPFAKERDLNFFEIIKAIKYAKNDEKVAGIILKLDFLDLSFSQIEELKKELELFKKSGKVIYGHGEYISKSSYLLGTVANSIQMNPAASTDLVLDGFNVKVPYFKNLANNFGVEFQVIHIGDFKTFGENYVKDSISEEFKMQYQTLLEDKMNYFAREISRSRKIDENIFKENFLNGKYVFQNSKSALQNKFIDKQISYEAFLNSKNIKNTISITKYYNTVDEMPYDDKIAVINLEGDISNLSSLPDAITPENVIELLNKAKDDSSIKGIVLRINSPGGSALAAELINQKVTEIKKYKPIYVSISEVAASGGYYIAAAGNKIYANENSITGSIGVVSLYFNLDTLYKKLGLKYENIALGKVPNSFDINKKIPDEEIALLRENMINIYDEFKLRVSQGRKIELDKVEELAQGKVYNGVAAKKINLVDQIGGLTDTVEGLANSLKLDSYQVVLYNKDFDKLKEYLDFSNYVKSNKIYENIDNIQNKINILEELNGKPSLVFPLDKKN